MLPGISYNNSQVASLAAMEEIKKINPQEFQDTKHLCRALMDTTRTVAMILFLVGGAVIFGLFMAVSRIPFELAGWVSSLSLPPFIILGLILLAYLFFVTFIEMIPLILLTIPIFYPVVVNTLGYDPIWFGVIIVLVVAIGVITPPVGINVFTQLNHELKWPGPDRMPGFFQT